MKKVLIAMLIILTSSIRAYTQDTVNIETIGENRPFTEVFDSLFRNIMYDTLSTKILYSKVIIT